MPRPLRLIADGLVYHVISRGNGRQPVFFADDDYRAFLTALGGLKQRKPFEMYGYCLQLDLDLTIRPRGRPRRAAATGRKGSKYSSDPFCV